jgi:hypothetical protein
VIRAEVLIIITLKIMKVFFLILLNFFKNINEVCELVKFSYIELEQNLRKCFGINEQFRLRPYGNWIF